MKRRMRTRSGLAFERGGQDGGSDGEDDPAERKTVGGKAPRPRWEYEEILSRRKELDDGSEGEDDGDKDRDDAENDEGKVLEDDNEDGDEEGGEDNIEKSKAKRRKTDVAGGEERGKPMVRHGRGRESLRWSAEEAKVVIKYKVTTAVPCPCEKKDCRTMVRVGKYAALGTGSDLCVHCGTSRKDGTQFRHASDLARHVNGLACRRARGLEANRVSGHQLLGIHLRHIVNAPENLVTEESAEGVKEKFKCPQCKELRAWSKRYLHAKDCFPKHGLALPGSHCQSSGDGGVEVTKSDEGSGDGVEVATDDEEGSAERVAEVTDDDTDE